MSWPYEDMLYLPHHVSSKRPSMSMRDRAAQFAPFAALTGHDAVIRETARLTDQSVELTQARREELDAKLRQLAELLEQRPRVTVTHFVPDERKQGGAYVRTCGPVRKIDEVGDVLVFEDGSGIDIQTVTEIEII